MIPLLILLSSEGKLLVPNIAKVKTVSGRLGLPSEKRLANFVNGWLLVDIRAEADYTIIRPVPA
jgi:hypothetical protein